MGVPAPISILVVEDNPAKKSKLFEKLVASPDIFGEPELAVCVSDAIRRLQEREYDLMILDVLIPAKVNGEPNELHSMDLLSRIDAAAGGVKRPRHVVALSSQHNLSKNAESFFKNRPWGRMHYSEESSQSLEDIENIGRWIFANRHATVPQSTCDVFVVAALEEPEFTELEHAFSGLGPLVPLDATHLIRFCDVYSEEMLIRVAIGFASRMGPVASAIFVTKAVELLHPKFILMAGICGAISSKADIGDLVVAESSWDWQSGKYVNNGGSDFEYAPHQLPMPPLARNMLSTLKRDSEFWESFTKDALDLKVRLPKFILGPMATGASVIADERITKKIKEEQHKNVIGVDMETYAVYAAAAAANYKIGALSMKAVCDKADVLKNDMYQAYAAKISARSVARLIGKFGKDLLSL